MRNMCETSYQITPILRTYVLHKLHGHDVGFKCFYCFLEFLKILKLFYFIFQVKFPRNFILSVLLKTLCTDGILKSACFISKSLSQIEDLYF